MNSELNLRNLLYYIKNKKSSDKEKDKELKDNIYDVIKDDCEYFSNCKSKSNLTNIIYTISKYDLRDMKLSEIIELKERFNKNATGMYGLEFDNQTKLAVLDIYGNPFIISVYNFDKKYYMAYFYTMNGQKQLYCCKVSKEDDHFSAEQYKEIETLNDKQKQYYKDLETRYERHKEIEGYKEYIKVKHIKSGYAHTIKEVTIKKDIPIELSEEEIVEYADGWSHNFGYSISKVEENDESIIYRCRINTD